LSPKLIFMYLMICTGICRLELRFEYVWTGFGVFIGNVGL